MSDIPDVVGVNVAIRWFEAWNAVMRFLDSSGKLPDGIDDKQLVILMTACGNARQRLREKSGG